MGTHQRALPNERAGITAASVVGHYVVKIFWAFRRRWKMSKYEKSGDYGIDDTKRPGLLG